VDKKQGTCRGDVSMCYSLHKYILRKKRFIGVEFKALAFVVEAIGIVVKGN